MLAGVVLWLVAVMGVVPLVCFLEAGLRLKLATLGIVQYITPTMQFLLGVFVFHEHFAHERGITFVLIWVALAIYTLDALRQHRMRPSAAEAEWDKGVCRCANRARRRKPRPYAPTPTAQRRACNPRLRICPRWRALRP